MLEQKKETCSGNGTSSSQTPYYVGGIICVIVAVVAQVTYAEVMQSFKNGSYNHLYFIRYCCMGGYTLAIIPCFFLNRYGLKKLKNQQSPNDNASVAPAECESYSILPADSVNSKTQNATLVIQTKSYKEDYERSLFQFMYTIKTGIIFIAVDSFFCGYSWYISLDYTTVAANNTMMQSQCVFILLFSALVLKTKITCVKSMAILVAVGGVAMVSFGTTKVNDDTIETRWYGYVACLIATILQAIAVVAIKYFGNKYFRHTFEMADNFALMTGMGIFILLCLWPGIILLDMSGVESFAFPKTYDNVLTVVLPIFIDAVYIGSLTAGITLTSPVFMSIGMLTVIPVSFMVDIWLHGLEVTVLAVIGSVCIFISFIVIEIPTNKLIPCIK